MNLTLLLIFVIALARVRSKPYGEYHIVNGITVPDIRDFPHHASLKLLKDRTNVCGASIISDDFLVTAAHCFCVSGGNNYTDLYIYVGSVYLDTGGLNFEIYEGYCYPTFDPKEMSGDIALIKIKECFDFNGIVKPITIITSEVRPNSTVLLIGWGAVKAESSYDFETDNFHIKKTDTNYLMKTFVNVIELENCQKQYSPFNKHITNKQICTHIPRYRGICYGDSGGPLIHYGRLAGIVSFTFPCSQEYPDVFTNIAYYVNWIQEFVNVTLFQDEEYNYPDYDNNDTMLVEPLD